MAFPEPILGFDVRTVDPMLERMWDQLRRQLFLLRNEVRLPLSTDPLVWPSAWTPLSTARTLVSAARGLEGFEHNLQMLEQRLSREAPPGPFYLIAVTMPQAGEGNSEEIGRLREFARTTKAPKVAITSAFLGYDVADFSMISGLTNCGYPPDQLDALRHDWVPYINDDHLFSELEPATRFRDLTNSRIPQHAPFFIFGVYRLTTTGQLGK